MTRMETTSPTTRRSFHEDDVTHVDDVEAETTTGRTLVEGDEVEVTGPVADNGRTGVVVETHGRFVVVDVDGTAACSQATCRQDAAPGSTWCPRHGG